MKNPLNIKPVLDWFGYTRRERRSTFILLVIIVFIIALRYIVPEKNMNLINAGPGYDDSLKIDEISEVWKISESAPSNVPKQDSTARRRPEKKYQHLPAGPKPSLNINTCDSMALMRLPGIGPVLSVRIIKYRNLLGGYARVDQLAEVYGLPAETFAIIKSRLYADSSAVKKIRINSGGFKELIRIPYIEKYEVTVILKFRELKGRIDNINVLMENKLIGPEKAVKMRPYLVFD